EAGRSHSVFNMAEVDAATQLVLSLCLNYPKLPWRQRIGIITPYKQQLRKLVEKFKQVFGERVTDAIEFNTVDGFQGQEKDVIIFSCVRAGGQGVGFLADERRMNVGLTRARKSLFVLGNAELLTVSPLWKQLVEESKARRLLKDTRLPLFGCRAPPGSKAPNLFQHVDSTAADGEGDRAEFTMETIDDAALDRRNTAVVEKAKAPSAASAASSVVSGAAPVVDRSQMSASEVAKEKRMLLAKTHEGTSAASATVVVRPRQQSSLFINRRKAVGRGGGGGNTVRTPSCDSASEEADRRRHTAAEPSSMPQKASQAPSMPSCGRPPQALPGLQLVTEPPLQVSTVPALASRLSPTPYSAPAAGTLPPSSTPYSASIVGPPPIAGPPPPPPLSANLPVLPPLPPDVSAQSQKVNYKRDKSREGRSRSPRRDTSRVPGERQGRGDHGPGRARDQNGGRSRSRSRDRHGKDKQNRNRNRDRAGKHGRDSDSPRDHSAGPDTPKPKKRQKRVGSLFRPSASVAKSMGRRPHKNDQLTRDDIITGMLDKRR
ncbi:DEAD-box type RNA helicase, partial [Coemansia erecta]